jgi:hypothetical protein
MARQKPIRLEFDPSTPNGVVATSGAHAAGAQVRRAVGNATSGAATRTAMAIPGIAAPLVAPIIATVGSQRGRVAVRDFVDGLIGNPKGGKKAPVQATPAPAPARARQPVEESLAIGRTAEPVITPHDRQLAFLDTVFRGPLTMREAAAYSQMLPQQASKAPTAKDTVLGETAKLSQAIYQNAIDQATELAKTDPEGARAITEKATAEYFNRQAGLVGFNPVQLAQAALMGGVEEE